VSAGRAEIFQNGRGARVRDRTTQRHAAGKAPHHSIFTARSWQAAMRSAKSGESVLAASDSRCDSRQRRRVRRPRRTKSRCDEGVARKCRPSLQRQPRPARS
jgi:hypothetical protein